MDWINEFYFNQQKWSTSYTSEITNKDKQKVKLLSEYIGKPPKKILELGAGGGQFAVAAANSGYDVTAIELIDIGIKHMKKLAKKRDKTKGHIHIIKGNFYEVDLAEDFDVICYWDGFGIGTDNDQIKLLKRIDNWLNSEGSVFIDIYTPWYWTNVAGKEMTFGQYKRKYDFDAERCRMLDTWWPKDRDNKKVTQKLRCYSPADIKLLLKDINLKINLIRPNGAVIDYETLEYKENVKLSEAMSYMVKFIKTK